MIESSIFRDQMMIRRQERPFPNIQTDSSNSQSGVSFRIALVAKQHGCLLPEDGSRRVAFGPIDPGR